MTNKVGKTIQHPAKRRRKQYRNTNNWAKNRIVVHAAGPPHLTEAQVNYQQMCIILRVSWWCCFVFCLYLFAHIYLCLCARLTLRITCIHCSFQRMFQTVEKRNGKETTAGYLQTSFKVLLGVGWDDMFWNRSTILCKRNVDCKIWLACLCMDYTNLVHFRRGSHGLHMCCITFPAVSDV